MSENNKKSVVSRDELKQIVKKRKRKKMLIVSCIAAAVLVVAVVVGSLIWNAVSVKSVKKRTDEQAQTVGTVGGYNVYYDEFSYLVGLHKADIEFKYGTVNWSGNSDFANVCAEFVQKAVLEDIEKNYVVLALCEQNGIDTDGKEINKKVTEQVKSVVDNSFGGKKREYLSWLSENGLSDAYYRLVVKVNILEEELLYKLVEEGKDIEYSIRNYQDFVEFAKSDEGFVRTTHVYYPKYYKYKDVDPEASRYSCEQISEALREIENNSDRYDAINDYIGACPYIVDGYTMNTLDGVYFVEGMMGEEYESAALSLDEYGVSNVVETDEGFFVIMRLPIDKDYVEKKADTLLSNYQMAQLILLENQMAEQLSFECDNVSARIKEELGK